jgi:hypothetical protein
MSGPTAVVPAVVHDMAEQDYHAHPAFSHSGAKTLLKSPALYRWEQDNGRPEKRAYDIGHSVHSRILGTGLDEVHVDAGDWRTKEARTARDDAYALGRVPLLPKDVAQVEAMVRAFRDHPLSALIDHGHGAAEVSMFWRDEPTGIDLRCRVDWLPDVVDDRLVIVDLKTADDASPAGFAKAAASYGYHGQDDWYRAGARALGLHPEPRFVFAVIETSPPYLVAAYEIDMLGKAKGSQDNRRAINTYATCLETGEWPGYSPNVELLTLPGWATYDTDLTELTA